MRELSVQTQQQPLPAGLRSTKTKAFNAFVKFMSLPDSEKIRFLNLEKNPLTGEYPRPTQEHFCKMYGVHRKTCADWKKKPEYISMVDTTRKQWGLDKVPNVLQALYNRCIKYGMAYDVETFLAYFANWNRTQISKVTVEKVDPDDLRNIISMLPMDKQIEAYEKLADIIGSANLERNIKEVNRLITAESETNSDFSEKETDLTAKVA